jgi:hypothetical protein
MHVHTHTHTHPWSSTRMVRNFPSLYIKASTSPPGSEYFRAFITISRNTSWNTGGNSIKPGSTPRSNSQLRWNSKQTRKSHLYVNIRSLFLRRIKHNITNWGCSTNKTKQKQTYIYILFIIFCIICTPLGNCQEHGLHVYLQSFNRVGYPSIRR